MKQGEVTRKEKEIESGLKERMEKRRRNTKRKKGGKVGARSLNRVRKDKDKKF